MKQAGADKPIPSEPELIQCEVCLNEIPGSIAATVEGSEYVHHYCGLDCLGRWRACAETSLPSSR